MPHLLFANWLLLCGRNAAPPIRQLVVVVRQECRTSYLPAGCCAAGMPHLLFANWWLLCGRNAAPPIRQLVDVVRQECRTSYSSAGCCCAAGMPHLLFVSRSLLSPNILQNYEFIIIK